MNDRQDKEIPWNIRGFAEYVRSSGLPLVIFGASLTGEILLGLFRRENIKVSYFCDNDKVKVGVGRFADISVVAVDDLGNHVRDAVVVIATKYILDAVTQLTSLGFSRWAPCSEMLREPGAAQLSTRFSPDYTAFAIDACVVAQNKYLDPEKLFLLSVDLIITERCSLRCVSCSNLMQYYERPQDITVEQSLADIRDLCAAIDEVNEVRVIGGDPFMNKSYDVIVAGLVDNPKINKIVLYSNGVITPREHHLPALRHKKVFVVITDYDNLSRNRDTIVALFEKNGIAHHVQKASGWNDCSDIGRHGRSDQELTRVFDNCCVKNYTTIIGGKLFRCPFSANADRLHAVPDYPDDYVQLSDLTATPESADNAKRTLKAFLRDKPFLRTCDFCNGRVFGGDNVVPGVQTPHPLPYERQSRES